MASSTSRRQGRYWLCTIPWTPTEIESYDNRNELPPLPVECSEILVWSKGQGELGSTGYYHWQLMVGYSRKVSIRQLQQSFPRGGHFELSRSEAANTYVWKEETRLDGTQFEIGSRAFKPNSKEDWDRIWELATTGQWLEIPANIRVIKIFTLDL